MPFKAKNNRKAVVVCAIHVVKRPSKRSVLVINNFIIVILIMEFIQNLGKIFIYFPFVFIYFTKDYNFRSLFGIPNFCLEGLVLVLISTDIWDRGSSLLQRDSYFDADKNTLRYVIDSMKCSLIFPLLAMKYHKRACLYKFRIYKY